MPVDDGPTITEVAVFGDIQGHADIYAAALNRLGVDPVSAIIPDHLMIVQAGDLIHKGPDSEGTVELAHRLLQSAPDRYVQLAGNHEGQYLGGPDFWPSPIAPAAAVQLATWFVEHKLLIAHAIGDQILVTHGGMSRTKWDDLGRPDSAVEAAARLNAEFLTDPANALMPGRMLRGETGPPGVAWTEPTRELYEPWLSHGSPPFSQVHGHASPFHWASGRWYGGVPRRVRKQLRLDPVSRRSELAIGATTFYGIDTAFGADEPDSVITPLMFSLDRLGQQAIQLGP